MSIQNPKTWDEIVAERKGISLEEQIAEREAQEKEQTRESLIEDIKDYTFKTIDTLVLPALTVIIVVIVIIKIIKKELSMKKNLQVKCSSCNNPINDEDLFCKHCGEKIIKDDLIENENNIQFNSVKQLPMKWFNFLTKYLLPIWLVFGVLNLILLATVDLICFIIELILLIVLFIAYKELRKITEQGYRYIMFYFIAKLIYPIIYMIIALNYDISSMQQITSTIITSLILFIPNIIYFKKRKHLFKDNSLNTMVNNR